MSLTIVRSIVIPALCIAGVNAYRLWVEHWEHKAHDVPLEEKPEYPYQNIRTKNFFWGDGDKVCSAAMRACARRWLICLAQTLFWNPKVNYHKVDEE